MRINELILENQQLDEISLGGVGKGIGKALGATARGVGATVGGAIGGARAIGSAARAGYQAGYKGAQGSILGKTFPADDGTDSTTNQKQTTGTQPQTTTPAGQTSAATTAATAPAQQQKPAAATQPAADDPALASLSDDELKADLAKKSPEALARAAKRDLGPRLNAMVQAELQKRQSQPAATAGQQVQPAASAAPAAAKGAPAMKAPPAVQGGLDGIKKAYSTLDPAERDQLKKELDIIDDQDRLASGTNESLADIIRLSRK